MNPPITPHGLGLSPESFQGSHLALNDPFGLRTYSFPVPKTPVEDHQIRQLSQPDVIPPLPSRTPGYRFRKVSTVLEAARMKDLLHQHQPSSPSPTSEDINSNSSRSSRESEMMTNSPDEEAPSIRNNEDPIKWKEAQITLASFSFRDPILESQPLSKRPSRSPRSRAPLTIVPKKESKRWLSPVSVTSPVASVSAYSSSNYSSPSHVGEENVRMAPTPEFETKTNSFGISIDTNANIDLPASRWRARPSISIPTKTLEASSEADVLEDPIPIPFADLQPLPFASETQTTVSTNQKRKPKSKLRKSRSTQDRLQVQAQEIEQKKDNGTILKKRISLSHLLSRNKSQIPESTHEAFLEQINHPSFPVVQPPQRYSNRPATSRELEAVSFVVTTAKDMTDRELVNDLKARDLGIPKPSSRMGDSSNLPTSSMNIPQTKISITHPQILRQGPKPTIKKRPSITESFNRLSGFFSRVHEKPEQSRKKKGMSLSQTSSDPQTIKRTEHYRKSAAVRNSSLGSRI